MPDEKDTATATAEPEATTGPLVSGETRPVPAAEQEPSEEKPSEEGAARGAEDEGAETKEAELPDPQAALRERLGGLDPEEQALLREVLLSPEEQERLRGDPAGSVDERLQELSAREAHLKRQDTQRQKLGQLAAQWSALGNQPEFARFNEEYQRQAKLVREGQAESLNLPLDGFNTAIERMQGQAGQVGHELAIEQVVGDLEEKLLAHPSSRYLSEKDRSRIEAAESPQERAVLRAALQLDAALERGAPAETVRRASKQAEEKLELTKRAEALVATLGLDGKGPGRRPEAGRGGATAPRDEAEARNWHAEGKWTSRQMREYLAKS